MEVVPKLRPECYFMFELSEFVFASLLCPRIVLTFVERIEKMIK